MFRKIIFSVFSLIIMAVLILAIAGCSRNNGGASSSVSPTVLVPKPRVESVVASTSGVQDAYYATLDIKVKNDGAEGTILVIGTVTQAGKSVQRQTEVFLKQGTDHELKLTYPLVWQGGDFTSSVQAVVP